jgi:predicted dehydrogenase
VVIRLGMLGFTPGNGHPYSFSAILNGYDDRAVRDAGWDVIADYLAPHADTRCGAQDARVVAAWGPDPEETRRLARACDIETVASDHEELAAAVDAVVLARDDWDSHAALALPYLEAGLPVFVDKPLTLDTHELARFRPYLDSGQLASWSGLRFAPELDDLHDVQDPVLVRGLGVGAWDRYAIHVLEPALLLLGSAPIAATPLGGRHDSVGFHDGSGRIVQIDVLGVGTSVGFHLQVASGREMRSVCLQDRFTAFERSLAAFVEQVRTGAPAVPGSETTQVIEALIAGARALAEGRRVPVTGASP